MLDPQVQAAESVAPSDPTEGPSTSLRRLGAALASVIVPGTGHLLLGQLPKGFCLITSFAMLLVCFWPLRLLKFYGGFLALYGAWIALYMYAACSVQMCRDRETRTGPSRRWFVVTLPISMFALSLSGAVLTRASGFRSFSIPSTSMEPAIRRGDRIVADTWQYRYRRPQRPEVIIFKREGIFFIKRVIAAGGDTVEGKDKEIFVNGRLLTEGYVEHTQSSVPGYEWMDTFGPLKVPPGKFFVVGDNRDISLDSRSPDFGLVDDGSIVGKPLYIFSSDREGANIH